MTVQEGSLEGETSALSLSQGPGPFPTQSGRAGPRESLVRNAGSPGQDSLAGRWAPAEP